MKPVLMQDKNILQGLSRLLHEQLLETYDVVAAPTLFHEVVGSYRDGYKSSTGKAPRDHGKDLVAKMAKRYRVLTPWHELCERELLGATIPLDGTYRLKDSILGMQEGRDVHLKVWSDGRWVSPHEAKAERIRQGTAELLPERAEGVAPTPAEILRELAEHLQPLQRQKGAPAETEVVGLVDAFLGKPDHTRAVLRWSVDWLHPERRTRVRHEMQKKWRERGRPPLELFAPYTRHCARVALLYAVGWHIWPKGREENDRGDVDYLRYLPFCHVFATDDALTRAMAPLLLNGTYQRLISGRDLKASLAIKVDGNPR